MFHRVCLATFLSAAIGLAGAQSPSGPSKPLPPGSMQSKVKAACTQCHNASRLEEQHLTRKEWSDKLDKMVGLGAEIADSDREAILSYLTKNFGPKSSAAKSTTKAKTANSAAGAK